MTLPNHHPGEELLASYAGGTLGEAPALVVATHMALCPCCRRAVTEMESIGGALLDGLDPDPVSPGCLEALFARIDSEPAPAPRPAAPPPPVGDLRLPQPLRGYVAAGDARWRTLYPGLKVLDLAVGRSGARARLIRMGGGVPVPRHTHTGLELALVLEGGFTDEFGHFLRGDVAVGDASVDHRPVADDDGCLCLSVFDAPLRLTGAVGRWLNPFMRM